MSIPPESPPTPARKAKIVATLGPACADPALLAQMIAAGLDTARLNFSHGDHASHAATYDRVRRAAASAGRPVAILADLCGPKLRIGAVAAEGVELRPGAQLQIDCAAAADFVGDAATIGTSYAPLASDLSPGDRLLIDDGRIALEVEATASQRVTCRVLTGGLLLSHKGLNLPGVRLSSPALTDKDRDDLRFAKALGVDYFALSFVHSAADVEEAKALAGETPVIAKIERPEAVVAIEEILEVADGIMVARGDLGVEAGFEKVPLLQKRLIDEANRHGKLVITATQMLESMISAPTPTRAEVSDVANALLDGTDAVMLSGETAVGRYPLLAVEEMASIIREIESSTLYAASTPAAGINRPSFSSAIAAAAVRAEKDFNLQAIVVYTETGHSAALISKYRPRAAIVALSQHPRILDRLALHWGVLPLPSTWVESAAELQQQAQATLLRQRLAERGDAVAITYGICDRGLARTNTLELRLLR
jgi:pyruvate kinase